MEVSAFAAYSAAKSPKSPNKKKEKSTNTKAQFEVSTTKSLSNKRKHTETVQKSPSKSNDTSSASVSNGNLQTTSQPSDKKKKISAAQSKSTSNVSTNGVTEQRNQLPSTSKATSTPTEEELGDELNSSSVENGCRAFAHILSGVDVKHFMENHWEKTPIYIGGRNRRHYNHLKITTRDIDEMLLNNLIQYTENIDVTIYENGVRKTLNPVGRALPASVWDYYDRGCSVRLINPQTYIKPLQKFIATLQEHFHCLVGANVYLTPPDSQGFAPHYDDIEAFVLQIEGHKDWFLYPPRTENEQLPRESSGNFTQKEIGIATFCETLAPGDLLYFPRGWIHQAKTIPNHHSLHITLSLNQKNAFADLFEELATQAMKTAIECTPSLRAGLPRDIWTIFGEAHRECEDVDGRREQLQLHLSSMFDELKKHMNFNAAIDKLASKFQHDALPPVLSTGEKTRTCFGTKPLLNNNGIIEMPELTEETEVRLLRAHILRLAFTNGVYSMFYHVDNSKVYHESDLNFVDLEEPTVGVIKKLIHLYPKYEKIEKLSDNTELAIAVVSSLWERGLVMTKNPLE